MTNLFLTVLIKEQIYNRLEFKRRELEWCLDCVQEIAEKDWEEYNADARKFIFDISKPTREIKHEDVAAVLGAVDTGSRINTKDGALPIGTSFLKSKQTISIKKDDRFDLVILNRNGSEGVTYYDCRLNYEEGKDESDYHTIAFASERSSTEELGK